MEPFVGSAAVFLNTDRAAACLSDVNPDLINLYRRSISCDDQRRGAVQELLALFLPAHAAAGAPSS